MTKLNNDIVRQALARKNDPEFIYKMHMAQARQSQKMFANEPEMLAKIDAIIAKIKQTYANALKEVA